MGAYSEIRDQTRYWSAVRFAQVRSVKQERARRAKHLPSELFAEPAWDILLELYSFQLLGRRVSEAELMEKVTVPATVAVRWIKMLEVQNLVSRMLDVTDSSEVALQLTANGLAAMDGYFSDQNYRT